MYFHSKVGHEYPNSPDPHITYFVCSTPRCGSSVFCEALCNTQLAGAPTEYFDKAIEQRFWKHWNVQSREEFIELLLKKKTSPNGVFGTKTHLNQYKTTFGFDELPTRFSGLSYIWIRRSDIVAQAVSYTKAVQLELWTHHGNARKGSELVYDFKQIKHFKDRVESEDEKWRVFFQSHNIEPLTLVYEDFSDKLLETVNDTLKFIGVEASQEVSIEPISLVKQADAVSQQWCERFRKESAN